MINNGSLIYIYIFFLFSKRITDTIVSDCAIN